MGEEGGGTRKPTCRPRHAGCALAEPLLEEGARLRTACRGLLDSGGTDAELTGCVAYPFLQWLAVVAGGWQWSIAARECLAGRTRGPLAPQILDCARFYGLHVLPRARTYAAQVEAGASVRGATL